MEYHGIRWVDNNTATRFTKEVNLQCSIIRSNRDDWHIQLTGTGDCEHHLVEDSAILLRKIAEVKCGNEHGDKKDNKRFDELLLEIEKYRKEIIRLGGSLNKHEFGNINPSNKE